MSVASSSRREPGAYEQVEKSNSPFLTPDTKSAHSRPSNMSGSRVRSLLSRTTAPPLGKGATSTHPPLLHRLLVRNNSVEWYAVVTVPPVVVLVLPKDVGDELGGLIDGQTLTYQDVEELLVDLHIVLLFEVKITYVALDVYKIVIVGVSER